MANLEVVVCLVVAPECHCVSNIKCIATNIQWVKKKILETLPPRPKQLGPTLPIIRPNIHLLDTFFLVNAFMFLHSGLNVTFYLAAAVYSSLHHQR